MKKETLKVCAKQPSQYQLTFFYKTSSTFQTNHWELLWVIFQDLEKPPTLLGVIVGQGHLQALYTGLDYVLQTEQISVIISLCS